MIPKCEYLLVDNLAIECHYEVDDSKKAHEKKGKFHLRTVRVVEYDELGKRQELLHYIDKFLMIQALEHRLDDYEVAVSYLQNQEQDGATKAEIEDTTERVIACREFIVQIDDMDDDSWRLKLKIPNERADHA